MGARTLRRKPFRGPKEEQGNPVGRTKWMAHFIVPLPRSFMQTKLRKQLSWNWTKSVGADGHGLEAAGGAGGQLRQPR